MGHRRGPDVRAARRIPTQGDEVTFEDLTFTAEQVQGRRIAKVLVATQPDPDGSGTAR